MELVEATTRTRTKKAAVEVEKLTLSVAEVAQALSMSELKIRQMIKDKEIPSVRAGRRILVRTASLDKWLEDQEAITAEQ